MLSDYALQAKVTKQLEELFYAKATAVEMKFSSSRAGSVDKEEEEGSTRKPRKLVSVLDSRRTQTMLIVLAKIGKNPEEIVEMSKETFDALYIVPIRQGDS